MLKAHLNTKLIQTIKEIVLRLSHGDSAHNVKEEFDQHILPLSTLDIVTILYGLKNSDHNITMKDIKKFYECYYSLYGHSLHDVHVPESHHQSHPLHIFKKENQLFESILSRIDSHLKAIEDNPNHETSQLQAEMKELGKLYSHYNRKEKLFFPILERYRVYSLSRTMWADDDRIRTLYKNTGRLIAKMPDIDFKYVKQAFKDLNHACKDMILQEEYFLLPMAHSFFHKEDWFTIAKESKAFGFAIKEPEQAWVPEDMRTTEDVKTEANDTAHYRIGGGYLTIKEVNHILNNLPLEITFVDKNGVFKYFNEIVESSEMMFIRTQASIGRNVAMCHPPKSMKKVMQLIRDLKEKKKTSETMWFKKKEEYVHVTYKGVFDDDGEFIGILEYVQNIQPFLDLPREIKRGLS